MGDRSNPQRMRMIRIQSQVSGVVPATDRTVSTYPPRTSPDHPQQRTGEQSALPGAATGRTPECNLSARGRQRFSPSQVEDPHRIVANQEPLRLFVEP